MKSHSADSSVPETTPDRNMSKGVRVLMGEPKKAVLKLAIPMIIAMSVQTLYNLVDAIWVSGLGADALAAVGFFFPFFFMAMAISIGLGIGAGSAISRRIGAKDKKGADNVAVQTMIMMVIIGVLFTIPLFIYAENIFNFIGAGKAAGMASAYGRIMFAGTLIIFFANISNAILRAEGDANRAMYAMMLGAGLNIALDPIFIYTLGFGVPGAGWATIISLCVSSLIMFYWLFIKRDTYVTFSFRGFKFDKKVSQDIFKVGLPAMVMQLSMAITMFFMNLIIVWIAGTDGVAVYTTGWRVVTIAILPLLGIATAVISVTGTAFGQGDFKKLNTAFIYAVKIGLIFEIVVAIATFIFAEQITAVFTQSEDAAHLKEDLIIFFRINCLFYPGAVLGIFASSMFQGTGKGTNALIATLIRTIALTLPLVLIFGVLFHLNLTGVWIGLVIANTIGSVIVFSWAKLYVRNLKK